MESTDQSAKVTQVGFGQTSSSGGSAASPDVVQQQKLQKLNDLSLKYNIDTFWLIIDQIGIFKAENIVDNKDQLIELIRQISEFIIYGQKYQREDYFESFMEKGTMNKLVFIHQ